jgi:hypothetical protein
MKKQVYDMVQYLAEDETNRIVAANIPIERIDQNLGVYLTGERKLRILFIEFVGTLGDVGKSMYYLQNLQDHCMNTGFMLSGLHLNKQFDVHLTVDCRCKDYISQDLLNAFNEDIKACGESTEGFVKAVQDQVAELSPDIPRTPR